MQVYASVPATMADAESRRLADRIVQLDQNRLKSYADKTQRIWLITRQQLAKLTVTNSAWRRRRGREFPGIADPQNSRREFPRISEILAGITGNFASFVFFQFLLLIYDILVFNLTTFWANFEWRLTRRSSDDITECAVITLSVSQWQQISRDAECTGPPSLTVWSEDWTRRGPY